MVAVTAVVTRKKTVKILPSVSSSKKRERERERERESLFVKVIVTGHQIKNTLEAGPKRVDKILMAHSCSAGQVEVANDAATTLNAGRQCLRHRLPRLWTTCWCW